MNGVKVLSPMLLLELEIDRNQKRLDQADKMDGLRACESGIESLLLVSLSSAVRGKQTFVDGEPTKR